MRRKRTFSGEAAEGEITNDVKEQNVIYIKRSIVENRILNIGVTCCLTKYH